MGRSRWWRAPAFVVLCGCLIALITYGLRTSFGLFATPISEGRGWSPEVFALAIAIQNIVWGIGQPFAGAVADRYGSARILAAGGVVYGAGVALMAVSPTPLAFQPHGRGARRPRALGRLVHHRHSGVGAAGAGGEELAGHGPRDRRGFARPVRVRPAGAGLPRGLRLAERPALARAVHGARPALAVALRGGGEARASDGPAVPARDAVRRAFGHGSYLLLVAGFFVCGFHVAFITTHLPAHIADVAGHSHGGHAG